MLNAGDEISTSIEIANDLLTGVESDSVLNNKNNHDKEFNIKYVNKDSKLQVSCDTDNITHSYDLRLEVKEDSGYKNQSAPDQVSFIKDNPVILHEVFTPDYNVTEEEVAEYANRLGINSESNPELLSLAKKALLAPLPRPWTPIKDNANGVYYFNQETGESSWIHPVDASLKEYIRRSKRKEKDAADTDSCVDEIKTDEEISFYLKEGGDGDLSSRGDKKPISLNNKRDTKIADLKLKEETKSTDLSNKGDKIIIDLKTRGEEASTDSSKSSDNSQDNIHVEVELMADRGLGGLPPLTRGLPPLGPISKPPIGQIKGKLASLGNNSSPDHILSVASLPTPAKNFSPVPLQPLAEATISRPTSAGSRPTSAPSQSSQHLREQGRLSPLKSIIKGSSKGTKLSAVGLNAHEKNLRFQFDTTEISYCSSDEEAEIERQNEQGSQKMGLKPLRDTKGIFSKLNTSDPWKDEDESSLKDKNSSSREMAKPKEIPPLNSLVSKPLSAINKTQLSGKPTLNNKSNDVPENKAIAKNVQLTSKLNTTEPKQGSTSQLNAKPGSDKISETSTQKSNKTNVNTINKSTPVVSKASSTSVVTATSKTVVTTTATKTTASASAAGSNNNTARPRRNSATPNVGSTTTNVRARSNSAATITTSTKTEPKTLISPTVAGTGSKTSVTTAKPPSNTNKSSVITPVNVSKAANSVNTAKTTVAATSTSSPTTSNVTSSVTSTTTTTTTTTANKANTSANIPPNKSLTNLNTTSKQPPAAKSTKQVVSVVETDKTDARLNNKDIPISKNSNTSDVKNSQTNSNQPKPSISSTSITSSKIINKISSQPDSNPTSNESTPRKDPNRVSKISRVKPETMSVNKLTGSLNKHPEPQLELEKGNRIKRATNPMEIMAAKFSSKSSKELIEQSDQDSDESSIHIGAINISRKTQLYQNDNDEEEENEEPSSFCRNCQRKSLIDERNDFRSGLLNSHLKFSDVINTDFLLDCEEDVLREAGRSKSQQRKQRMSLIEESLNLERSMNELLFERQLELKKEHEKTIKRLKQDLSYSMERIHKEAENMEDKEKSHQHSRVAFLKEKHKLEVDNMQKIHLDFLENLRRENDREIENMKKELNKYLKLCNDDLKYKVTNMRRESEKIKQLLEEEKSPFENFGSRENLSFAGPSPSEEYTKLFMSEFKNLRKEIESLKKSDHPRQTGTRNRVNSVDEVPCSSGSEDHNCRYGTKYMDIKKKYGNLIKKMKNEKQKRKQHSEPSYNSSSNSNSPVFKLKNRISSNESLSSISYKENYDDHLDLEIEEFVDQLPSVHGRNIDWMKDPLFLEGKRVLTNTEQFLNSTKILDNDIQFSNLDSIDDHVERIIQDNGINEDFMEEDNEFDSASINNKGYPTFSSKDFDFGLPQKTELDLMLEDMSTKHIEDSSGLKSTMKYPNEQRKDSPLEDLKTVPYEYVSKPSDDINFINGYIRNKWKSYFGDELAPLSGKTGWPSKYASTRPYSSPNIETKDRYSYLKSGASFNDDCFSTSTGIRQRIENIRAWLNDANSEAT